VCFFVIKSLDAHDIDHVRIRDSTCPVENCSSDFSSKPFFYLNLIQIDFGEEADKAAREFTASVASAYRLATSKIYTTICLAEIGC
jgi:hypothetical protein